MKSCKSLNYQINNFMKKILFLGLALGLILVFTGCGDTTEASSSTKSSVNTSNKSPTVVEFSGKKGTAVTLENGEITLDVNSFTGTTANYYNTELSGKTVYFFVVRDSNGIYRAAANACQVCADAKMGFTQQGNNMVCNTCGNKYPLEKIATEKGGCNPVPINPSLEVSDEKITILQTDLSNIVSYF